MNNLFENMIIDTLIKHGLFLKGLIRDNNYNESTPIGDILRDMEEEIHKRSRQTNFGVDQKDNLEAARDYMM